MQPEARKFLSKFQHPNSAWIILACSIFVTLVGWLASVYVMDQKAEEIFRLRVREATQAIAGRLKDCEFVLQSSVPAAKASDTRGDWENYIQNLKIEELFPGIIGLGYVSHVPAKALPGYLAAHGNPNNHPYKKNAPAYAPITFVGTAAPSREPVVGFDMYSEPVRKEALDRARRTGKLSLSSPAKLLTGSEDPNTKAGLLMYLPVFRGNKTPGTELERERQIQGYVYGVFRVRDLIAGLLGTLGYGLNVEIAEEGEGLGGAEKALFASRGVPEEGKHFVSSSSVEIGGRHWVFRFSATDDSLEGGRAWHPPSWRPAACS